MGLIAIVVADLRVTAVSRLIERVASPSLIDTSSRTRMFLPMTQQGSSRHQRQGPGKDESKERLSFQFAPGWPKQVKKLYVRIFAFEPQDLEGRARLGEEFAFSEVPEALKLIQSILRDLADEPWAELPTTLTANLHKQLSQLLDALDQIQSFSPAAHSNPKSQRDQLARKLGQQKDWLLDNGRPHTHNAHARRALEGRTAHIDAVAVRSEEAEKRLADIDRQLSAMHDVAKTARQVTGEAAGEDLAVFFRRRAERRGRAALMWGIALSVACALTLGAAVGVYEWLRPDEGPADPAAFARLALAALIIGIFLFGIRICAQQFRINRHLEAVAQTKTAALSTFTPLVTAFDEVEMRSAIAAALAHAVFETEDTGLIDGSSDHVTVVERALAMPRMTGSGGTGAAS